MLVQVRELSVQLEDATSLTPSSRRGRGFVTRVVGGNRARPRFLLCQIDAPRHATEDALSRANKPKISDRDTERA